MFCQVLMLTCMVLEILRNEHLNKLEFKNNFIVFFVKLPCTIALHMFLTPEINKGVTIMKFANNQEHQFDDNGAAISFMLGLFQALIGLYC